MTDGPPDFAVRVSLRHPDGTVVQRVRLRWRVQPSAAEVVRELAGRSLAARRQGLRLEVVDPTDDLADLLALTGLR